MKARVKATRDIVDVLPYADEDGTVRFYANMENKWHEAYEIDIVSEVIQPDYWEKLKHQAAIAAMQGMLSNSDYIERFTAHTVDGISFVDDLTSYANDYATALVEKLKNEQLCAQ